MIYEDSSSDAHDSLVMQTAENGTSTGAKVANRAKKETTLKVGGVERCASMEGTGNKGERSALWRTTRSRTP
jgi:hypothetical protein